MRGGIISYNGLVASGPPEAGMFCFPESLSALQLPAVAWFLEDGSLSFLGNISANALSPSEKRMFLMPACRSVFELLFFQPRNRYRLP